MKKILTVLCFMGSSASAGPFGLSVDGFDPDNHSCSKMEASWYSCTDIPNHHSAIETYVVKFIPEVGVCLIKGIGNKVETNGYGSGVKDIVDELYGQISPKYGKAEKMDFILPNALWDEPDEWLMSIAKNERGYGYIAEDITEVEGIVTYGVVVQARSRDAGAPVVEFYTKYDEECDDYEDQKDASSF